MSGEVEIFQKIHNSFKKLQRLRGLVTLRSKINSDVFDVFCAYLSELMSVISVEYDLCVRRSSPHHLRLAAMQLALHYETARTSMLLSDRPTPTWFQGLENCLRQFEDHKMSDELLYIYFRALNYLWLVYVSRCPDAFATAADYAIRTEKMYECLTNVGEHKYYDCPHLFARGVDMPTMEHGREEIDIVFTKNLQLLEAFYQGAGDTKNLAKILQLQMKIRDANVPRLVWVQKIVALAPPLLKESKLKMTAYYLIVALKMLRECNESEQKSDDIAVVRLVLATEWMNYAFAVLASSIDFLRASFSDEVLEPLTKFWPEVDDAKSQRTITPGTSRCRFEKIGDTHATDSFDTTKLFDSISLSPQEMSFCMQSIEDVSTGQKMFSFVIGMICDFVDATDVSTTPMKYIIYQYQLLDLFLIRSIFEEDPHPKYSILKTRFERCDRMIQTMNEECPKIFEIANGWILNDLNDILLDLYQCNLTISNMDPHDVKMLREKLVELRMLTMNTAMAKN